LASLLHRHRALDRKFKLEALEHATAASSGFSVGPA
jgi:hypothetical protein